MVALLLLACTPAPDAPEELDALVGYLYAHAMDEDDAALAAGGENLVAWMDSRLAETLEGYRVNNLDPEALAALDGRERSAAGLLGAAVGHESPHTPWTLAASVALTSPLERNPERALDYRRENEVGLECFVAETCDRMSFEAFSTSALPLGIEVESHVVQRMRWFTLPDGGAAYIQSNFMVEPAEVSVGWLEVVAQYYAWVSVPHGDGSRNMIATWAETRLTGESVPESLGVDLAIGTMQDDAATLDAWASAHPPQR
ncbi:MAG: hypothetical protein RLZZ299_1040 [Pseudomonadota bacterium]